MSQPNAEFSVPLGLRSTLLTVGMLMIWLMLAVRLLHLQFWNAAHFASIASRQQVSEEVIRSRPGDIVDRRGRLLATTVAIPSFYVDPQALDDQGEFARQVAPLLGLDPQALGRRLQEAQGRRFLWVKRRLTEAEAESIRQLKLPRHVGGLRQDYQRYYPQGALAAHVLGLRDIDGQGRGGVEQTFHPLIRGVDGKRRFVRDARGQVLDVLEEVTTAPQDGAQVRLTLDCLIQLQLERQLEQIVDEAQPQGVCGIVLDPQRGEILAMASRPAFDPNQPQLASEGAWKNLCIAAMFEPGSTFKPLVVARALDKGVIARDELIHCQQGTYRMGPRILHDHHPYGYLSLTDVLVKSSNIGMAQIGERLGNAELLQLAQDFGFGQPTGIELPGELSGMLHPLDQWTGYSTGSVPMGQELAATPLQVLTAHAVLANGGRRLTPHLLLGTSSTATPAQIVVSQVATSGTARWLVTGPLVEVIERGTGTKGGITGIDVFGKTGTAQKTDPATGKYSQTRHVSSFVCGAPAENPQVLVLITVDEPQGPSQQFGGQIAAPAAAAILRETLEYLKPAFLAGDRRDESGAIR